MSSLCHKQLFLPLPFGYASADPAGLYRQGFGYYYGLRSCRARTLRMLRRLMSAIWCWSEPSGKSGRAWLIRTSRSISSIRVRRINSLIDSTRIVASIVFVRANRGLLAEAPCSGGGGCIACDRNEEEGCFSAEPRTRCGGRQKHLRPSADERCEMAGS